MEDRNRVYQGRRAWGTTCLVIYIVCYVVLSVCDWRHVITFSLSTTFFFFFFIGISSLFPFRSRGLFLLFTYIWFLSATAAVTAGETVFFFLISFSIVFSLTAILCWSSSSSFFLSYYRFLVTATNRTDGLAAKMCKERLYTFLRFKRELSCPYRTTVFYTFRLFVSSIFSDTKVFRLLTDYAFYSLLTLFSLIWSVNK